jgi:hypothetical protein
VRGAAGLIERDGQRVIGLGRNTIVAAAQLVGNRFAEIAEVLRRERSLRRKREHGRARKEWPHSGALGAEGPQFTVGTGSESTTVCWPQPHRTEESSRHTSDMAPGASAKTAKAKLAATQRIARSLGETQHTAARPVSSSGPRRSGSG